MLRRLYIYEYLYIKDFCNFAPDFAGAFPEGFMPCFCDAVPADKH